MAGLSKPTGAHILLSHALDIRFGIFPAGLLLLLDFIRIFPAFSPFHCLVMGILNLCHFVNITLLFTLWRLTAKR